MANGDNQPAPLGMGTQAVSTDLQRHFSVTLGRDEVGASRRYLYQALGSRCATAW